MVGETDYGAGILTVVDEDGQEQQFELLDELEIDGQRYFALTPYYEKSLDALDDDGALIVLKSETVDGEEMMATIEDDEEHERIGSIFIERLTDIMWEDDGDDEDNGENTSE